MTDGPVASAIAQPFIAAVTETFAQLLGLEVIGTPVEEIASDDLVERDAVSALIEFGGPRFGIVLMTFGSEVAKATVERLLRDAGGVEDGDITDGVGELANIVAGRAKAVLSALGIGKLDMGVPTVVTGFSIADLGLSDADWSRVDFASEVGGFTLRVAFSRPKERTLRVLLGDDSKVMRKIERSALAELGPIEFVEASNGGELLTKFKEAETPFDLVVLDVKMPDVDGYEAMERLRAEPKGQRVPVVIVSSLPQSETEPRMQAANKDGAPLAFVGKPFDSRVLLAVARELVGKAQTDPAEGAAV